MSVDHSATLEPYTIQIRQLQVSLLLRVSCDEKISNLVVDGFYGGGGDNNYPAGTMVVLTADPSHPKPTDR